MVTKIDSSSTENSLLSAKQVAIHSSYILFIVCFGIPVWWLTTTVDRAYVPYSAIENELSQLQLSFKVKVNIVSDVEDLESIWMHDVTNATIFQYEVNTEQMSTKLRNQILEIQANHSSLDAHLFHESCDSLNENSIQIVDLSPFTSIKFHDCRNFHVGQCRSVYVTKAIDDAILKTIKSEIIGESFIYKVLRQNYNVMGNGGEDDSNDVENFDLHDQLSQSKSGKYAILFTMLIADDPTTFSSWNINEAISNDFEPFLDSLGDFFSLKPEILTQVIFFSTLNVKPKPVGDEFILYGNSDLNLAINSIESRLTSHISSHPRINFVVYLPPRKHTPLYILDENGVHLKSNAFFVPKWGGVKIFNPVNNTSMNGHVDVSVGEPSIMDIFISQFHLLMGIPRKVIKSNFPLQTEIPAWKRDLMYRLQIIRNVFTTRHTLQSLASLLHNISYIVIKDEVGDKIGQSVNDLLTLTSRKESRLTPTLLKSQSAFRKSESAFFDPSLLGLLYFPEDQKSAVYIPLFVPMCIPIVLSLPSIVKFIRNRFRM